MKIKFRQSKLLKVLSVASIIGLSLGIAALVVVMSVADGFEYRIEQSASKYLAPITLTRHSIVEEDFVSIQDTCKECNFIKFSTGKGVISKGVKTSFALIDANDFNDTFFQTKISDVPTHGVWPLNENEIVVGSVLAKKLELSVGEIVNMFVETSGLVSQVNVTVVGIQNFGYHMLDERLVYMSSVLLPDGFKQAVKVYPPKDFDKIFAKYFERFSYPWILKSWKDLNPSLMEAIAYEKVSLFLVMAFIVLMAVLNISATTFTIVFEKRSEYSILRAQGLEKKAMVKNLVSTSSWIVIRGVILGILLGVGILLIIENFPIIEIPKEIYGFSSIPSKITWSMLVIIFIFSLTLSLIGALIPAIIMAGRPISEGLLRD